LIPGTLLVFDGVGDKRASDFLPGLGPSSRRGSSPAPSDRRGTIDIVYDSGKTFAVACGNFCNAKPVPQTAAHDDPERIDNLGGL
jgi:hypothetical protein